MENPFLRVHKGLNSANNLNELGGGPGPQVSNAVVAGGPGAAL